MPTGGAGFSPILGTWCVGRATQAFGTVITQLVPPYPGPAGASPFLYTVDGSGNPNWMKQGTTRVKRLEYTTAGTLHQIGLLRPFNWTYFPAGLPKNTTLIPNSTGTGIKLDPGVFSTNYKYPIPVGAVPGQVADNAIAANDYVVYQLVDGTWQLDTIASGTFGSALTLTTGTPNRAGGAIAAGAPFFWFGVIGDSDPATGQVNPQWDTVASTTTVYQESAGLVTAMRPGDSLIFYSNNPTATGKLSFMSGTYDYN